MDLSPPAMLRRRARNLCGDSDLFPPYPIRVNRCVHQGTFWVLRSHFSSLANNGQSCFTTTGSNRLGSGGWRW